MGLSELLNISDIRFLGEELWLAPRSERPPRKCGGKTGAEREGVLQAAGNARDLGWGLAVEGLDVRGSRVWPPCPLDRGARV